MTDAFTDCLNAYKTQLQTLATSTAYFPAATGRAAGWQITEDDNVVFEGGDYFIVLRPGNFQQARRGGFQDNVWSVRTFLFMRFSEYVNLWAAFRAFRAAVLELPDTEPLTAAGIRGQVFNSSQDAGYLLDANGNYTNFVTQTLDCVITQRVKVVRAF